MTYWRTPSLLPSLLLLASPAALALDYQARFTAGGYLSQEDFAATSDLSPGDTTNDFATFSTRAYFRASNVSKYRLQLTADLRDKHDLFDKLDAERLALIGNNTFQLRQLSASNGTEESSSDTFFYTFGRFSVFDAGAINNDGLEAGWRWDPMIKSTLFFGLNPKRPDQTSLGFNRDSQQVGITTTVQPKSGSWSHYSFANAALVAQVVQNHVDRAFLFSHMVYQWDSPSQVLGEVYLDFVPRVTIQSGFVSYFQELHPRLQTDVRIAAMDAIQYSRRRGILETLAPSPYREIAFSARGRLSDQMWLDAAFLTGTRVDDGSGTQNMDQLKRSEWRLGPNFSQLLDPHFSGSFNLGRRHNFTADEWFLDASIGYYSKAIEVGLRHERILRTEESTNVFHPSQTEVSLAYFFSKQLYGTGSLIWAGSESVRILSSFFKVGYRFGSGSVPPLRDGAPPRGGI